MQKISGFRKLITYFGTVFLLLFSFFPAIAQTDSDPITITGKVLDQKTGKAVEAATVEVTGSNGKDSAKIYSTTDKEGKFIIKVPQNTRVNIIISAIGFEKNEENFHLEQVEREFNAGKFLMITDAANLANVVVTAKKPAMTLAVDRRIFNADAAVTAKGGNAVDLMKNIPSLSVDATGNVQLRNSSPQILVDGRPTILTLEQIPADDIDKVEVITNPSAKYDASNSGGIINIILKKNRKNGLNGMASIGAGSPSLFNGSLNLNYRQGKLNFFTSANYNRSGGTAKGEAYRENKSNGAITDYFDQVSENERTRRFYSIRAGVDYFINEHNTLSFTQGFVDGKFGNDETQNQNYFDAGKLLTGKGYRRSIDDDFFNRANSQLNYRRTYEKPGKEWTADFTYNGGNNGGDARIINQLYDAAGNLSGTPGLVNNYADGDGKQLTIQTDYVNPISEKSKLELGIRSNTNLSDDKLDVYSLSSGTAVKLPLSNNYSFRSTINAVYGNYSNAIGKLKYQGGLRLEQSSFKGELLDSAQKFGYNYPKDPNTLKNTIFPSLFLTYELGNGNDLQLNFSRRIIRPNFWQINPYVDISDPMNIRKGNPELRPEFINSFELNYNKTYSSGNFLVSSYYHNNTEDITQYSDTLSAKDIEELGNASIDPNAILTTFINAERTNRMGMEMTLQQRIGKNFDFSPNFNAQYRDLKAMQNGVNLNNYGFNWSAKLIMNYKITTATPSLVNNLAFQLSGQYESPRVIPQGKQLEQYGMDFAIRKDFLKNKAGTITFNVNDVLNSRKFGSITDTDSFYQDSYRRWNVRSFRLSFSYRFGKSDLNLFKHRHSEEEG